MNAIAGRQFCRRDLFTLRRPWAKRDRAAPTIRIWHFPAIHFGRAPRSERPVRVGSFLTKWPFRVRRLGAGRVKARVEKIVPLSSSDNEAK